MLNNILNLEGAQVLNNNEQKEVNGGNAARLTTCKAIKKRYDQLFFGGASFQVIYNFRAKYARELVQCGIA
jgi:hypothetical protein